MERITKVDLLFFKKISEILIKLKTENKIVESNFVEQFFVNVLSLNSVEEKN